MSNEQNKEYYIRIAFEGLNEVSWANIPILNYREEESYVENVDRAVAEIYDDGGFWLNETTIIPYHRIISIQTVESDNKTTVVEVKEQEEDKKATNDDNLKLAENIKKITNKKFRRLSHSKVIASAVNAEG